MNKNAFNLARLPLSFVIDKWCDFLANYVRNTLNNNGYAIKYDIGKTDFVVFYNNGKPVGSITEINLSGGFMVFVVRGKKYPIGLMNDPMKNSDEMVKILSKHIGKMAMEQIVADRFLMASVSSTELEEVFSALQNELGDSSRGSGAGVSGFAEQDLEMRRNGVMRFRYHHYSGGSVDYKAIKDIVDFIIKSRGYQVTYLDNGWKRGSYSLQLTKK